MLCKKCGHLTELVYINYEDQVEEYKCDNCKVTTVSKWHTLRHEDVLPKKDG